MIIEKISYEDFLNSNKQTPIKDTYNLKADTSRETKILLLKIKENSSGIGTYLVKWLE